MSTEDLVDQYIPEGHVPNSRPLRQVYAEAARELMMPYPAVKLKHFPKLNAMTKGFRAHEYTILCGQTGSGKTTLLANVSRDLTEQGIPHFVASVETGDTDFVKRTMSAFIGQDWNTGDQVAVENLKAFHARFGGHFNQESMQLSLYDNRIPVETMMADIAWHVKEHKIKVAMIDNLNFLLDVKRSQDMVLEMDRVTHELIIFAKRVPVHIIMVMHPRKTVMGRIEHEDDIKGSSTANQEAHNILLWNRPHPDLIKDKAADPSCRELLIAKMRRNGKFVRNRLIMWPVDGVGYKEGEIVCL